jgi:hypothetical protein
VHSHEIWEFGMLFEISWADLLQLISFSPISFRNWTYKIFIQIWHNPAIPISIVCPKSHGRLRAARDLEIESRFRERRFARCVMHWRNNLVSGIMVARCEVCISTRLRSWSFVRHDELSIRVPGISMIKERSTGTRLRSDLNRSWRRNLQGKKKKKPKRRTAKGLWGRTRF